MNHHCRMAIHHHPLLEWLLHCLFHCDAWSEIFMPCLWIFFFFCFLTISMYSVAFALYLFSLQSVFVWFFMLGTKLISAWLWMVWIYNKQVQWKLPMVTLSMLTRQFPPWYEQAYKECLEGFINKNWHISRVNYNTSKMRYAGHAKDTRGIR